MHVRLDGALEITDVSPLAECLALETISLPPNAKNIELLRKLPKLKRISFVWDNGPNKSAAEFWKEYDEQGWLRTLRATGFVKSARQLSDSTWDLDFSKSAIADLTPLQGQRVSRLILHKTTVADLAPLRGMPLKNLDLWGARVRDLSPLQGAPLETLVLTQTLVSDLAPLRSMPLVNIHLHGCQQLTDVSPLAECQELKDISLPRTVTNAELLRKLPKLARIGFAADSTIGFRPDMSAAQFWREFDLTKKK